MSAVAVLLATAAVLALAVGGLRVWDAGRRQDAALVDASPAGSGRAAWARAVAAADRALAGTARGRRVAEAVTRAGVRRVGAAELVAATAVATAAVAAAASTLVATWAALVVAATVPLLVRTWLRWRRERLRLAFLAAMPEVARLLSNATSAGLSIRSALELAVDDVGEPVSAELAVMVRQMSLGVSMEAALLDLEARLPGRELSVLVSTLVISQRSGGSLITALRQVSTTLEDRQELGREVRTQLAQATYTGWLVVAMGVGLLLALDGITPGLLRTMTEQPLGQVALAVAALLFGAGIVVIRRMTRIET